MGSARVDGVLERRAHGNVDGKANRVGSAYWWAIAP
jgi:hypothetical protein